MSYEVSHADRVKEVLGYQLAQELVEAETTGPSGSGTLLFMVNEPANLGISR